MKLNRLYFIIIFVAILISYIQVNAQDNNTNQKIEQRLDKLESVILGYNNVIDRKNNEIYNSFLDLKKEWSDEIIKLEAKKKDVDNTLTCIAIILGIVGISSIVIILKGIYGMKKNIDKKFNEGLEKQIEVKKEELVKIVGSQQLETKIMNDKLILVIFDTETDKSNINQVIDRFNNVEYCSTEQVSELNFGKYNLVLFNDIAHNRIKECIEQNIKYNKLIYIYYGEERLNKEITSLSDNINFANTKLQLYQNMMNSLKYQDIIL